MCRAACVLLRRDRLINGAADLFAHLLNAVQRLPHLLRGPSVIRFGKGGEIGQFAFNTKSAAQQERNALRIDAAFIAVIELIASFVVETAVLAGSTYSSMLCAS